MGEYFLGFDIGTDSVGWAVTDEQYRIIKRNGKALWGVRLFDSAETAEDRRKKRIDRRRYERRKQRLQWLQDQFANEIASVDPAFFERLRESEFLEEDKRGSSPLGKYTLFSDKGFCDKDYFKQYPTIYHLRKALMEEEGPFDIRLVYLAIHHIMKNRGHFLYGNLSLANISLENGLERLNQAMKEEMGRTLPLCDMEQLCSILLQKADGKENRYKALLALFSVPKKDRAVSAVLQLLAGKVVKIDDLFGVGTGTKELSKISLEDDFETIQDQLTEMLGDRLELILAAKEIWDWAQLESIRGGERYLSEAKVKAYDAHQQDLKRLKAAVKALEDPVLYHEIFHCSKNELNNYTAYSGKGAKNYRCKYEDFCGYLEKQFKKQKESSPAVEQIRNELKQGAFLRKQTGNDNGLIPYQLHEIELVQILKNAQTYLPFLNQKDESGLTLSERILEMFRFRVPYYVGPLDSRSRHSWVIRTNEKITPWNFKKVVNLEESRARFIQRMMAKCSYLGEPVLPKGSLLYTKYMVLNELNNLRVNGKKIPVEKKQEIYQDLFLPGKRVTASKLRTYLQLNKEDELSGFDQDFKGTLAPWNYFRWLLERPHGEEIAEEIIRTITLFGEDKELLKEWIKRVYGEQLSEEEQRKALRFQASGWGRLSRTFLTEIYHTDPSTGEALSIIDLMWQTNHNLMELLSSRFTFMEAVEAYREKKFGETSYTVQQYLDESYASPAIKRAIHQVLAIADEVQGIMKGAPKRIFVEMARGNGEKGKRTVSRKKELIELYKVCGEEANPLFEQLLAEEESSLRRDKLYLYYTQMGKCMYSGEPIALSRLGLDSDYDIDHIYPRSKVKDDSLSNRVLVKKVLNRDKTDIYPISHNIQKEMHSFWTMLREKGFISKEKYDRLMRSTEFTADELAGFIARQLVETRQSSKIAAELLHRKFGDSTEIVYVKAGNVASFRQDQRLTDSGEQKQASQCKNEHTIQDPLFVKCREINDYHHAKDAYLNIVVGNVYHIKFTQNPLYFIKKEGGKYSLNCMFDFDVERNGETAWTAGQEGSISIVRHTMRKNNILFTRRAYEQTGKLFNQKPVAAGKGQAMLKRSDPRMSIPKYGGYNKIQGAYFAMIEHTKKGKRIRSLEAVRIMYKKLYETDPERYCREILKLEDPVVLIPKIRKHSLISYNGFRMYLSRRSGSQLQYKNANQLVLDPEWHSYVKAISKYLDRCKQYKKTLEITKFDGIDSERNEGLYQLLLGKLENSIYRIKYTTLAAAIREHYTEFLDLDPANQCRVLMGIMHLFTNDDSKVDLTLIGGKANMGILQTTSNLSNYQEKQEQIKLIHQSVTGFYEQEVDLLAEKFQ